MNDSTNIAPNLDDLRSKKEIQSEAVGDVNQILEEGNTSPLRLMIAAKRLQDYLTQYMSELEYHAVTEYMNFGEKTIDISAAKCTEMQGSKVLDYDQDMVYAELKKKLDNRKKMIDLVHKTKETMADEDGAVVPNVKVKTVRKNSFQIKY